jgi:hypothetical protein
MLPQDLARTLRDRHGFCRDTVRAQRRGTNGFARSNDQLNDVQVAVIEAIPWG